MTDEKDDPRSFGRFSFSKVGSDDFTMYIHFEPDKGGDNVLFRDENGEFWMVPLTEHVPAVKVNGMKGSKR